MSESISVLAEPAGSECAEAPDEDVMDELDLADELLVEEISIDGMCGVY